MNFLSSLTSLFTNLVYIVIMIGVLLFINKANRVSSITIFMEYATYFMAYLLIFKEIFINFKLIQKFVSDIVDKFNIDTPNILPIFKGYDNHLIPFKESIILK